MVPKAAKQLIIEHIQRQPRHHLIMAGGTLFLLTLLLLVTGQANAIRDQSISEQFAIELDLPEGKVTLSATDPQANWKELSIQAGDSLSSLMERAGLSQATAFQLSKLKHGRKLRLC